MKRAYGLIPLIALLAACGGAASTATPAKPKLSAATACGDFQKWAAQFPTGPSFGAEISDPAKMGPLIAAVATAPSGQLYVDLKTLGDDITQAATASKDMKPGMQMLTVGAAQQVEQDCSSVNPAS